MSVFADTSGLYAMMDRSDANHSRAIAAWTDWVSNQEKLRTNNYVVLETVSLLQNRIGLAAVRTFSEDIVPVLHVDWVSEEQHRAGVAAVLAASRRKLSLVDCVSFQTMRLHGLRIAFSFDSHFKEQGFETRPSRVK
jgi:predicted nucleic acid-binding protein